MSIGNFCLTRIKKLTGGQAGRRLNKPEMGKNPQNKSTQKKKNQVCSDFKNGHKDQYEFLRQGFPQFTHNRTSPLVVNFPSVDNSR